MAPRAYRRSLRSAQAQKLVQCPACKGSNIITDPESGEVVCRSCGCVISDREIASGPEWRSFESGNDGVRTGAPTSLARHDMGLATVIGNSGRDASGQRLDPTMRVRMSRLRLWDSRSQAHSSTERSLQNAFNQLARIRDEMALSGSVVEKAAYIYRKAHYRGLTKGRTIAGILAASVYLACREMAVLRTLDEIAATMGVKNKEIARCYRMIVFELDLKVPNIDTTKCVARISNKLNLDEKTKRKALDLIAQARRSRVSDGKDPMGLAASALYIACIDAGKDVNQHLIAEAADVTEVTIRNRSKEMKAKLHLGSQYADSQVQ